ncbi:MAG: rhomboid family intramembrane serine protease [Planctomycetota bacterium]|jgi:membrane associated rhomboid family serine protease
MLIPIGDVAPREKTPVVNYALIGVNLVVFALIFFKTEGRYGEVLISHGLVPGEWNLLDGLTSMFLHAGIIHLLGNMLLLWIAGDNVEDRFGHAPYFVFYLAAGAAAAAAQVMLSTGERMLESPIVGASGAVSGVIGAYLVFFPRSRIKMLLWIIIPLHVFRIPSWTVILLWVALQAWMAWQETQGVVSNIAVWAHLGGFAFGFAVALLVRMMSPFRRPRRRER